MKKVMEKSTIKKELKKDDIFIYTTVGTSMWPMLRNRRDNVVLEKPHHPLRKYDVALYITPDKRYVLHRIIAVKKNTYVFRGDNRIIREAGIAYDQVIGVLKGFYRNDKFIDCTNSVYRCYSRICPFLFYPRYVAVKIRRLPGKLKSILIKTKR